MPGVALSTDLYELTMLAGYRAAGMTGPATFELFVRRLPPNRSFLVAAGVEQAIACLERLRFTPAEIEYLRRLPNFASVPADFFDEYLPAFRFTGEVWSVAEGTPVFPPAPMMRITAPLGEAQLVETALLGIVMFQTSVASRAARVVEAAAGRPVVEFGMRRAHGLDAGLHAARAAYVAGCEGTSNVEAGWRFGIPVSGTMAHSWVMAFADELEAFRRYAAVFGDRAVLLLDTYDTLEAVRRIVAAGLRPPAVRLDSGHIAALSREVRRLLDAGGLTDTRIFVSGDLDEHRIAALLETGAPVDGFGVGAAISTSSDAPSAGGVYKLVEIERAGEMVPLRKLSPGKATWPGRKQVWRVREGGAARRDVIGLAGEDGPPGGEPLLAPVMRHGRRLHPAEPLEAIRRRCRQEVAALPAGLRSLTTGAGYPVETTPRLADLLEVDEAPAAADANDGC